MTPEVLAKAKAATVFITVGKDREQRSGSGFLTIVNDGTGYIATNAHVLVDKETSPQPRVVNCTFHSGTKDEKKLEGKIASLDFKEDLALVEVKWDSLPDPIDSLKPAEVAETQTVFILGFPFGELLATKTVGLNHTISRSSISSIRVNGEGEVVIVQLDGGLNPGNSGGPVIDAAGKLVGVAVAKVAGSEIGFAIPGARATRLLHPQSPRVKLEAGKYDRRSQTMQLSVQVHDPLGKVRELRAYLHPDERPGERPYRPDIQPAWRTLASSKRIAPAEIKPVIGKYTSTETKLEFEVPTYPATARYSVQLSILLDNDQEDFYSPLECPLHLEALPRDWSDVDVQGEWQAHAFTEIAPAKAQEIDLLGKITQVIPAGGGKYLAFVVAEPRQVVVLDVARAEIVFVQDLPANVWVTANREELLVGPERGVIKVWSLENFERQPDRAWKRAGEIVGMAMGWNSTGRLLVLSTNRDDKYLRVLLLDPKTFAPVAVNAMHARMKVETGSVQPEVVLPDEDGQFLVPRLQAHPQYTIRASGLGYDFCFWSIAGRFDSMIYVTQRGPWLGLRNEYQQMFAAGSYWPNPQGTRIHSLNKSLAWNWRELDRQLVDPDDTTYRRLESEEVAFPAYHPDWFLGLSRMSFINGGLTYDGAASSRNRTDRQLMSRLPPLADLVARRGALEDGTLLSIDQCVHWYPDAAVLITINRQTNRITHRYLPKPTALRASDRSRLTPAEMTPDERAAAERKHNELLDQYSKTIKMTWPKVDSLAVAAALPPRVKEIPGRINIPGHIRDVVAGGSGRYLFVAETYRPVVSVFDVTTCSVVKEIPCPPETLLCAGRDDFILVSPEFKRWERWSLSDFTRRAAGNIKLPGTVVRIAMGAASTGPVMVICSQPNLLPLTTKYDTYFALLSPADFRPLTLAKPDESADLRLVRPANGASEAIFAFPNQSYNGHLYAAANGQAFTIGLHAHLHLTVTKEGLIPARLPLEKKIRTAIPSADGSLLMASGKLFSNFGFEPCGDIYLLPTMHSQFALAAEHGQNFWIQRAVVINLLTGEVVGRLPNLQTYKTAERMPDTMETYQHGRRLHFVPQSSLLVTVPFTNDHLALFDVPLSADIRTTPLPPAPAASTPQLAESNLLPPSAVAKWTAANLPAVTFEEKQTIPIPGEPTAATIAGSGRYMCLRFRDTTAIAIFDVCSAKLVKRLDVDADAVFAGYREGLLVISPKHRVAELLRLPDGESVLKKEGVDWHGVIAAAAGHHSQGPFGVLKQVGDHRQLHFYSLPDLKLIPVEASNLEPGPPFRPTAHLSLQARGLQIGGQARRPGDQPQPFLRASALGNLFGYGDEWANRRPFALFPPSDGRVDITTYQEDFETLTPLADGLKLATKYGVSTRNLWSMHVPFRGAMPTAEPGYFLTNSASRNADGWRVHVEPTNEEIGELPGFGRDGYVVSDESKSRGGDYRYVRMPERLHVIPSLGVMAVVPKTNDRLIFDRFKLKPIRASLVNLPPGASPTTPPSTPTAAALVGEPRLWKDNAGKEIATGTPLAKTSQMLRITQQDGEIITVPLQRLSPADQSAVAALRAVE